MSRLRTNIITNRMANGAPTVSNGLVISGITTTSEVNVGQGVTFSTVGNATFSGIVTATSFVGSGADLTGITQTTINSNAANRIITGSGSANTLEGNSNFTYTGSVVTHNNPSGLAKLDVKGSVGGGALGASISVRNTNSANNGSGEFQFQDPGSNIFAKIAGINLTDGSNNGYMTFHTSSATSGLVERLRITDDGKMGLGINSPTGQFAVSDGTRIAEINPHSSGTFIGNRSNHPILFQVNASEKVRIDTDGKLTMASGTVELQSHMIRVGNRTTAQINAGVSTSTGALLLDTTDNNLKYYANASWKVVKQQTNDGSSQNLAARSAKALLDDGITTNGVYWLDMHGAYSLGNAKRHYCLMDSSYDGGGWTMLYSMNHGNNFASGSNYSFSLNVGSPTTVNDFTAGNWGYDRRNTFLPAANDQFLIRRTDNNDWKRFVVSVWSPTYNSVSNGWETTNKTDGSNTGHPYWALGQMYDASGNSVSGHTHFNGCALGGNCNSGGGDGSGFGNYSQWLDCVGNSGFGGGYNSQGNGGSPLFWGQNNALSQGGSLYIQMFYRRTGTQ